MSYINRKGVGAGFRRKTEGFGKREENSNAVSIGL